MVKKRNASPQNVSKTRAPTAFEERLFAACKRIPTGKVTTYGTLAKVLGSSARAVGQGMRRNPFAPVVPCHRVVASDLQLGGFNGSWGAETDAVKRKRSMLEAEGIKFLNEKIAVNSVLTAEEMKELCMVESASTR